MCRKNQFNYHLTHEQVVLMCVVCISTDFLKSFTSFFNLKLKIFLKKRRKKKGFTLVDSTGYGNSELTQNLMLDAIKIYIYIYICKMTIKVAISFPCDVRVTLNKSEKFIHNSCFCLKKRKKRKSKWLSDAFSY